MRSGYARPMPARPEPDAAPAPERERSRLRLSRWHQSSYETEAAMARQRAVLSRRVEVLGPEEDAELVVVTSGRRVDAALLDRAPSCRWVLTTTSGVDHLDLDELRARGIGALRCPQPRREAVVEAALGLLIEGLRRRSVLSARAAAGTWARAELPELPIKTLHGNPVGVVGLGEIGGKMARVLQALGAEVLGHDPRGLPPGVRPASPEELVRECVALTLHCSLGPGSRGLLDAGLLGRAGPGLVLVNTARGDVLDLDAAVAALDAGRLSFLGVDVFPEEPYPRLAALAARPDCVVTPHSAGWHERLLEDVDRALDAAVAAIVAGEPPPHRVC